MALMIVTVPTTSGDARMYRVGHVQLKVSSSGDRTRVETVAPATRAAVEGYWLNDTEAIEAFHGEYPLPDSVELSRRQADILSEAMLNALLETDRDQWTNYTEVLDAFCAVATPAHLEMWRDAQGV